MKRTDLMDTSEWAHRVLVERLRSLTPEQRLQMTLDRVETGRSIDRLARERRAKYGSQTTS